MQHELCQEAPQNGAHDTRKAGRQGSIIPNMQPLLTIKKTRPVWGGFFKPLNP
jgi:hypothetical protein